MKLLSLPKLKTSRLGQIWFTIRKVIQLAWEVNPAFLLFAILTSTVMGLFIYPTLRLEKMFIDTLVKSIGQDFTGTISRTLILILTFRFLLYFAQDLLSRLSAFFSRMMSRILSARLTMLVAKKNIELDVSTLENPDYKDKFSKIQRESSYRAWGLMMPFTELPMYVAGILSTLLLVVSFRPVIGLIVILLSIPEFFVDAKYIKREYQFDTESSSKYRLWGWLEHYLVRARNVLEIKLLNLSAPFSQKIFGIQNEIFSERIKIEKGKTTAYVVASLPQSLFLFLASIYFAFSVVMTELTVGSAEMLLRAMNSFRANLTGLVRSLLEFYENYLYVSDLVWLLELKPTIGIFKKGKKISSQLTSGIEFKNVWFRYKDDSQWILNGINLKIDPKETVAIVGENGAGKSTLIKLLCRFYDPQKGHIYLNGVDLKKYSIESLWQSLSVLFQDFEGYPFTARESIGYGNIAKINQPALIKAAANKSDIHQFIDSLPLKYENPLDPDFEKGVKPSFGQWQRIGLARVFFRNTPIEILDEPTSNIDPRAEEEIFEEIISHSGRKILILISHRFSTVRRADKIFVMDKGKILEEGSHEQLMKKKSIYADLFELQAKSYR